MPMIEQKCQGPNCQAPISWLRSEKGRPVPVDVKPIRGYDESGKLVAVYLPHFAMCPDAELFGRKKKKKEAPVADSLNG